MIVQITDWKIKKGSNFQEGAACTGVAVTMPACPAHTKLMDGHLSSGKAVVEYALTWSLEPAMG